MWDILDQLKAILQDEWSKITMSEIRQRIKEMPSRCQQLVDFDGKPIQSDLW